MYFSRPLLSGSVEGAPTMDRESQKGAEVPLWPRHQDGEELERRGSMSVVPQGGKEQLWVSGEKEQLRPSG